jgi:cystathionine gamma-synthase/cystathionine gamma-lyase/cystathionine beta-lyase
VAGSVAGSAELVDRVRHKLNIYGGTLDPHAGYLLARGLKTLALRVRAQNANAQALATFLAGHEKVAAVNYAGLPGHPDHAHAVELLSGFGGMLSFRLSGGLGATEAFLEALRLPTVAPSLGSIESLVTRPAITSHAGMSPADREKLGVTDDLIRFSCGIEHPDDLIGDLTRALDKI